MAGLELTFTGWISWFFNLVQLSQCLMQHRVSFVVFSGTEDLRAFSISSGVDKVYLVDVCIKLGEALADNHVLIGLGEASCKINKIINS